MYYGLVIIFITCCLSVKKRNDNAVRQIKIKIMNFGTPQEMIDEERDYYESIGEKPPRIGCLPFAILIVILIL